MKKFLTTLMIIFFPIGIIFCIGKNLFSGGFASFLGGLFLCLLGAGLAIYFLRYDIIETIIAYIVRVFTTIFS